MSINRIKNFPSVASEENEAFVMCPEAFLANLTPEQYQSRLGLYRRAYEKAHAQLRQSPNDDSLSFEI